MSLELLFNGDELICIFGGRVDFLNHEDIRNEFENNMSKSKHIVFDMGDTDYVSPVFLQVVAIAIDSVGLENFSITNVKSPQVKKLLKLSNLDKLENSVKAKELKEAYC